MHERIEYVWFSRTVQDCRSLDQGFSTVFHVGPKEVMLEGQINTTFWAFPIYFYVFQRWSKGQTKLVGGPDFSRGLPVENPCTRLRVQTPLAPMCLCPWARSQLLCWPECYYVVVRNIVHWAPSKVMSMPWTL